MKAVIIAGGQGKRMGALTENTPKPMIALAGKPILQHQIEMLARGGLNQVIILSGYKGEVIKNYFGDRSAYRVNIQYIREDAPLGTAGAVKQLEDTLTDDFLVLYGDIMLDIDLDSFVSFHLNKKSSATIVVHPNDHPADSDLLDIDDECKVTAFYSKPHDKHKFYRNLVNAGLFILSPQIFKYIPENTFSDFGKDIFPKLIEKGEPIYAYGSAEYIKDVGTIERLKEVERDVIEGRVAKLNKKNKRRAIFLDRDGVINYEDYPLISAGQIKLLSGVADAVKRINKSGFLCIVATNQPVIAKGLISKEELNIIHAKLDSDLGSSGAYLDKIYYCPHHPQRGFEGERAELKIECKCRKPGTALLQKATEEFNIDMAGSFFVGDRTVDIMTGINAGLTTILVKTGYAGKDGKYDCQPDYIFNNLYGAVDFILNQNESPVRKSNKVINTGVLR